MSIKVKLKSDTFIATQWFKDGDHEEVFYYKERPGCSMVSGYYFQDVYEDLPTIVDPGDWIVEMFDGVHIYEDDEFKELFRSIEN